MYSGTKSALKLINGSQPVTCRDDVGLGDDVLTVDDVVGATERADAQDAAGLRRRRIGRRCSIRCVGAASVIGVAASVAAGASLPAGAVLVIVVASACCQCRGDCHRRTAPEDQLPSVESARVPIHAQDQTPFHFPLVSSAPPVSATPSCDGL